MAFFQFPKYLHRSLIPQIFCLCLHLICGFSLIKFLSHYRNRSPVIQNSPHLTIVAQLMLITTSMTLFLSKMTVINLTNGREDWNLPAKECYGRGSNAILIILNIIYTFCIEFMYMAYLLKMIRVIRITCKEAFIPLFRSQTKLIGISALWGLLIASSDILMKIFLHNYDERFILLYPQFNQFMCDSRIGSKLNNPNVATIIYSIKLFISLSLFIRSWYGSYDLEEIDESLKLKLQYFVLLCMSYSVIFTDKIIKFIDHTVNTSFPVHYVDCLSNLVTGMLLLLIHVRVVHRNYYLPDANFLQSNYDDIYYLLSKPESYRALSGYFKSINRHNVFEIQVLLVSAEFNHHDVTEEILIKMQQCLTREQVQNIQSVRDLTLRFDKAKTYIHQQMESRLIQWMNTVSGAYLKQKWARNQKYLQRMKQLNLICSNQNTNHYIRI